MKLKGKFKDKFDFFVIFTDYEEAYISDYIDVGLAPKGTPLDKFTKSYFRNRDVQLNLKRYKINPLHLKIEKVSFKEWYDNYEDSENSSFYDFISEEYQGKAQAEVYIDGFNASSSEDDLENYADIYGQDTIDYIKKTRGFESMNKNKKYNKIYKSKFLEASNMRILFIINNSNSSGKTQVESVLDSMSVKYSKADPFDIDLFIEAYNIDTDILQKLRKVSWHKSIKMIEIV